MGVIWEQIDAEHQKEIQRRAIFRTAAKIGGMLLFLAFSMQLLAVSFEVLVFGMQEAGVALSEGMQTFLTSYFPCLLADVFALLLGCVLFSPRWKTDSFQKPDRMYKKLVCGGVVTALGGSVCAVLFINALLIILQLFGYNLVMPDMSMPRDSIVAALCYLGYVCLIGPFMEELLFRGLVLRALQPYGNAFAILASALLFGVFHANPLQFFTGLFVGLLLGFLTVKTNSIWPAVMAHIFNNTFVTLPEIFFADNEVLYVLWSIAYMGIGGLALLLFIMHYRLQIKEVCVQDNKLLSNTQKFGRLVMHPLMILYVLYFVAMCVLFFDIYLV